jgi:hypothetical protein
MRHVAITVGIAIDDREIVLVNASDGSVSRMPYGGLEALKGSLQELCRAHGGARIVATVALLPPLVDVRAVELPRLKPDEVEAVLANHSRRHFPAARTAQVTAWRSCPGGAAGAPLTILAAAVPSSWPEALHQALSDLSWNLCDIIPAHGAWLAAADRTAGPNTKLQIQLHDRVVQLTIEAGRATDVRTIAKRPDSATASDDPSTTVLTGDPALVAALHAAKGRKFGWSLVPDAIRIARRKRLHVRIALTCGFAAMSLVLAGSLELWGIQRELDAVREAREGISGDLATISAKRDSLTRLDALMAQVDSVAVFQRPWSTVITTVTEALPPSSYLNTLTASGDSVVLDGVAISVDEVRRSLAVMPGAAAVVARTTDETPLSVGEPLEPFRFVVRLNPRGTESPLARQPATGHVASSSAQPKRIDDGSAALVER